MGKRSTARKLAMQLIFQMGEPPAHLTPEKIDYFLKNEAATLDAKKTALDFVNAVEPLLPEIDKLISAHCKNWPIERLSATDRAILRLAFYELAFLKDTPPSVIINEALELSKKFSSEDASGFINGVLDGYFKEKK
jgi:N utilization substance protein B